MADDTTTTDTSTTGEGDTTETDTETTTDETSTAGTEDLAGLKTALAAERKARKDAERDAKANATAAAELAKVKQSAMTDAEKAIAAARAEGAAEAAKTHGRQLAQARLETAAATKGVDLSDLAEYIDATQFLDDKGEVDNAAIKKAVDRFAKATGAKTVQRGSGDFSNGTGAGSPITEDQLAAMSPDQIAEAMNAGKLKHLL